MTEPQIGSIQLDRTVESILVGTRHRADLGDIVLLEADLEQGACDGGGDLGVDLVGGDLEQRLVDLDAVADLDQDLGHRDLIIADIRHKNFDRHSQSPYAYSGLILSASMPNLAIA